MNPSCLRFIFLVCAFFVSADFLHAQDILIEDVIFSVESDPVTTHTPTSTGGLAFQSYPNPTSELLTIETIDMAIITQITIVSLADQSTSTLTPQSEANRITLSVGVLAPGTYAVTIATASGTLTKTIQITN